MVANLFGLVSISENINKSAEINFHLTKFQNRRVVKYTARKMGLPQDAT
jgi:hypothetical protein